MVEVDSLRLIRDTLAHVYGRLEAYPVSGGDGDWQGQGCRLGGRLG